MLADASDCSYGNSPCIALLPPTKQEKLVVLQCEEPKPQLMDVQVNVQLKSAIKCIVSIYRRKEKTFSSLSFFFFVTTDNFPTLAAGQRSVWPHQGHGSVCTEQGAHHRHLPRDRGHPEPHHAGPGTGGHLPQGHLRYPLKDPIISLDSSSHTLYWNILNFHNL